MGATAPRSYSGCKYASLGAHRRRCIISRNQRPPRTKPPKTFSRHARYQAEFQVRRKKTSEGWADFADELKFLADKAYPDLQEEARERLSINAYLAQLPQPQIGFSVRQKQPATLDDAVAATLEMESYLPPHSLPAVNSTLPASKEPVVASVDAVDKITQLTRVVEKLAQQVERLQHRSDEGPAIQGYDRERRGDPPPRPRRQFSGEC